MMTEKASTLNYGGLFKNRDRASEMFVHTGRDVDPEALICLDCTLPANNCNKNVCQRYIEGMKKIKEQQND